VGCRWRNVTRTRPDHPVLGASPGWRRGGGNRTERRFRHVRSTLPLTFCGESAC